MSYFHQNSCSIKYFFFNRQNIINATLAQEIQARQQRETTKKVPYNYDNLPNNKRKNNKNTKQWLKACITSRFLEEQAAGIKKPASAASNNLLLTLFYLDRQSLGFHHHS